MVQLPANVDVLGGDSDKSAYLRQWLSWSAQINSVDERKSISLMAANLAAVPAPSAYLYSRNIIY